MPKQPIDYSKTIIYKIVCNDVDVKECYVGQTTSFTKRKISHKSNCNNFNNKLYNVYLYQFIREHNDWGNWEMIEVEKYKAIDKLDAGKRERYWIETLDAKLNKVIPTRQNKEWSKLYREENREEIKNQMKIYREINKEQIVEQRKMYREQNKEQLNIRDKQNYERNKEQILKEKKLYRDENREKINARQRLKRALKKEAHC